MFKKEGSSVNPFATLPRLREGRKIIGKKRKENKDGDEKETLISFNQELGAKKKKANLSVSGSTFELFSSCFEVPSPRVTSPTSCPPSPGTRWTQLQNFYAVPAV